MTRAILTDIEGTTSSISFVKDVLFPYARRALPGFVKAHGDEPAVRKWLDAVAAENGGVCRDEMIVEVLQGWIDQDRKHTALKALQGMIWANGYGNADFTAHVYPDAVPALRAWHADGLSLHVYSSGSVPGLQCRRGVRVDVRGEVGAVVAGRPDHALQRLQRGVLAVLVDPALQHLDDHLVAAHGAVLGRDRIQPLAYRRVVGVRADKAGQGAARIREQHVLDERDAAGGAFDVGQDGLGHGTVLVGAASAAMDLECVVWHGSPGGHDRG